MPGRIAGLLGAYLLLIQLLFFARLPWFVRHMGLDRPVIWHRLNGQICLGPVLAHVVLITIGYALFDHISITAEIAALLGQYAYPLGVRLAPASRLLRSEPHHLHAL